MNPLNLIYQAMLKTWNVTFDQDMALVLKMAGTEVPVKVDGKQVYLATGDNINGMTMGKVFFHPACESIMSKETEIFKVIRKLTAARIFNTFQPIAQVLFSVAGKVSGKTTSSKILGALDPFKNASKNVKEDVMALIKGIGITLEETSASVDNRLISWNMVKGGKNSDGEHVHYTATPVFPFYDELFSVSCRNEHQKAGDKITFNGVSVSKEAIDIVTHLFEFVWPNVNTTDNLSYSVVVADVARLTAYLQSYALVCSEMNIIIKKFRKDFESIGIYEVDLGWVSDIENLPELKGLLPILDYNNHNVSTTASGSELGSRASASTLFNSQSTRQPSTPVISGSPFAQTPTNQPVKTPNVPPTKGNEQYIGVHYLENNGLFEFRFQQPNGMLRVVGMSEDGRIISENYQNPQPAMQGMMMPGMMMPGMMGGMNIDPMQLQALINMQNGIPPIMGLSGGGMVRDSYTGNYVQAPQASVQDPWGNNNNNGGGWASSVTSGDNFGGSSGINNW